MVTQFVAPAVYTSTSNIEYHQYRIRHQVLDIMNFAIYCLGRIQQNLRSVEDPRWGMPLDPSTQATMILFGSPRKLNIHLDKEICYVLQNFS
jgi:hypothetical protein